MESKVKCKFHLRASCPIRSNLSHHRTKISSTKFFENEAKFNGVVGWLENPKSTSKVFTILVQNKRLHNKFVLISNRDLYSIISHGSELNITSKTL